LNEKPIKNVVSLSGGKDSTAMILMMLEKNMPVDLILFCDTGKEFPAMLRHIDKLEKYIERPIIRLKAEREYDYYLYQHKAKSKNHSNDIGYGWPFSNGTNRWCTSKLKTDVINRYLRELNKNYTVKQYVGIAADEPKRIKDKIYPLYDFGITEKEALQYCYNKGFDWEGLYEIFDRVSCWCCPFQSLDSLRNLRKHFPKLWDELRIMDKKTWNKFKADYTAEQLEMRFEFEEKCKNIGMNIKSREFFKELKILLKQQGVSGVYKNGGFFKTFGGSNCNGNM
jgi:3'-phosphoadenosine 5'-phosphosulfate sulfotransferase (PAPS reductase)/FAD synthetase